MNPSAVEPGVHRIAALAEVAVDGSGLTAGWRIAHLAGGRTKAEVLAGIAAALSFPDWFGGNLDALWDCLTDLTEPTMIIWQGWEDFAVGHSRDWAALLRVFDERTRQSPAFALVCT